MHLPVSIELRRSRWLVSGLLCAHLLAALVVFLPEWPLIVPLLASLLLLVSAVWGWFRCLPAVAVLRLRDDGRIECRRSGDTVFEMAQLLPDALVHPALIVLYLQLGEQRLTVVVAPDSAPAAQRRCLRVWLRWRADFRPLVDAP